MLEPQLTAPGRLNSIPKSHSRQLPLLPISPSIVHVSPSGFGALAMGTRCRVMHAAPAIGIEAKKKAANAAARQAVDVELRVRVILIARGIYRVHAMVGFRQPVDRRKLGSRQALPLACFLLACALAPAGASGSETALRPQAKEAHAFTDGHLRPGHLETIRVKGFPGSGRTEVAFFPTAICGNECAAASRRGGRTGDSGAGKFVVRMPGAFVAQGGKHVYFRDGERIDLRVDWYGPQKAFEAAFASPEPIIVRTHRSQHG